MDETISEAGGIYIDNTFTYNSIVKFEGCSFKNVVGKTYGGAVFVENKGNHLDVNFTDTSFENIFAHKGGIFFA